jgi:hypothetical protein
MLAMEAQGIEPRPSPCKGDVLPLDYASASNFYDKVLFIFLLYAALSNDYALKT